MPSALEFDSQAAHGEKNVTGTEQTTTYCLDFCLRKSRHGKGGVLTHDT